MPKLPQAPSRHEDERRISSDSFQIAQMSRFAVLASVLSILPACNNTQSGPALVVAPPAVFVPPAAPAATQQTKAFEPAPYKPKTKPLYDCADKAADSPDVEKQEKDESFASARFVQIAFSDFYKDPFNAKLYAFSLEFAKNSSQELYLGLLECRPGYGGTSYLSQPNKLQVFQQMRDYYNKQNQPDPDILRAIDAKIAAHGGKRAKTP